MIDEFGIVYRPTPPSCTLGYTYTQAEALTAQEREPTGKAPAEVAEVWSWMRREKIVRGVAASLLFRRRGLALRTQDAPPGLDERLFRGNRVGEQFLLLARHRHRMARSQPRPDRLRAEMRMITKLEQNHVIGILDQVEQLAGIRLAEMQVHDAIGFEQGVVSVNEVEIRGGVGAAIGQAA